MAMLDPMKKYACWFMFENHTFQECTGNLYEIKGMLHILFLMDKHGGWGKLRLFDSDAYFVTGLQRDLSFFDKYLK